MSAAIWADVLAAFSHREPLWRGFVAGGIVLVACGLWLILPRSSPRRRMWGTLSVLLGVGSYLTAYSESGAAGLQIVFWLLAAWTVTAAAVSISMPSAVYAAVWFAASLVGVSGLLLLQGAQFLGAVTLIIYAGAIVVMFLFVIMLAQPRGHEVYDRLTWSLHAKFLAAGLAAVLPALLVGWPMTSADHLTTQTTDPITPAFTGYRPLGEPHAAGHTLLLGKDLFSRYLIHVEVAGTLLLAALVGAMAIVLYGRSAPLSCGGNRHE